MRFFFYRAYSAIVFHIGNGTILFDLRLHVRNRFMHFPMRLKTFCFFVVICMLGSFCKNKQYAFKKKFYYYVLHVSLYTESLVYHAQQLGSGCYMHLYVAPLCFFGRQHLGREERDNLVYFSNHDSKSCYRNMKTELFISKCFKL